MTMAVMNEAVMGPVIGRRIAEARKRLGWSQQQLAIQSHVDRSWIAALEAGNTDDPGAARVLAVARAMGTDPIYLLTGERADSESESLALLRRIARRFSADELARWEQALLALYYEPKHIAGSSAEQPDEEQGRGQASGTQPPLNDLDSAAQR